MNGKTIPERVFAAMEPGYRYSTNDIADATGLKRAQAYYGLRILSRGGVVDLLKEDRRNFYISKQMRLPI